MNMSKNLQRQFQEVTKTQSVIQERYKELWSWHGTLSEMCQFRHYQMEGYMKKFVEKVKLFQKTVHPTRYFILDFQTAILTIKHDHKSTDKSQMKKILFRDILDCYLPLAKPEHKPPKGWEHCLYLRTTERLYFLCARTLDDRNMWMSGFRYLLASTVTVQAIMRDNSKKLEEQIKQQTEQLIKKKMV